MKLAEYSDEDLQREMSHRARLRREKQEQEWYAHATRMNALLTRESVDVFVPEHDRTSCSDERPVNCGHGVGEHAPRCTRCELLRALRDGWCGRYRLRVSIEQE
jgi:hypothetical protein